MADVSQVSAEEREGRVMQDVLDIEVLRLAEIQLVESTKQTMALIFDKERYGTNRGFEIR